MLLWPALKWIRTAASLHNVALTSYKAGQQVACTMTMHDIDGVIPQSGFTAYIDMIMRSSQLKLWQ